MTRRNLTAVAAALVAFAMLAASLWTLCALCAYLGG